MKLCVHELLVTACQEKNCPPEKFYPRTKIFSDCVENFCPTLKIFVHLAKSCLPDFLSALATYMYILLHSSILYTYVLASNVNV